MATDANFIDTQTISLCSDMIDVCMDVSMIYSSSAASNNGNDNSNGHSYCLENDSEISLLTDGLPPMGSAGSSFVAMFDFVFGRHFAVGAVLDILRL